jgi:hypothetical protein
MFCGNSRRAAATARWTALLPKGTDDVRFDGIDGGTRDARVGFHIEATKTREQDKLMMPWIRFDMSRKSEIIEAHRLWARDLPRATGRIGGAITGFVEGPQIGNTVTLSVDSGIYRVLKK